MPDKNPHRRHRKFNTRETYPEQNLDNDLCQVVLARGTLVFVRGQVSQEIEGFASIAEAGAGEQAEQAMRNLTQLLREVGADLCHICRIQIYITERADRDAVYRVIGKHLKGVFPVSTGLIVRGLARPEWLMEIEATAVIPECAEGGAR
ncbi:MAG: Rid family hydrolase [Gammaproteobacteria bacterium]